MRRPRLVAAVVTVTAAAALVGCSGGGGPSDKVVQATGGEVTVEARDNQFDVGRIEADAGDLEVTLVQKGAFQHTFVIEDVDDFKLTVDAETDSDTGTVTLDAGEFEFYCDVPGHRAQGMEGALVVS